MVRTDTAVLPAPKVSMATQAVLVPWAQEVHEARPDNQSLVPGDPLEPPVSMGVTASLARTAEMASQVEKVTKALPVVMAATVTLAATADLVIVEPAVRLVKEAPEGQMDFLAAKVTQGPEVLQEPTVGTAGLAPLALQVFQGALAPQGLAALRDCQVPRATRVAQVSKVPRETGAPGVPWAFLAPMVETVSPVVPAEMVLMERTAKTVLHTPSASLWLASSSCLSTASASVPVAIWAIPTPFFPRSPLVVTLWQ